MSDIHIKLAKIAGLVGPINKTERNTQQGFNFRSIEAMTSGVRQLFANEGVSIAPRLLSLEVSEVESAKGSKGYRTVVHMAYTFTAGSDDSSVEVSMPGEAVDYGDKSTSKAVQMAYKYALTQVLIIGSGDPDPDTQTAEIARTQARSTPRSRPNSSTVTVPLSEAVDLAARQWVNRLKMNLIEGYEGDQEKARAEWTRIVGTYSYQPDQEIKLEDREAIERDVANALLPADQAPYL